MANFNANGVNLYYELKGNLESKETIVFFNGIMSGIGTWTAIIPELEKLNYKILLHDFKGQLLSDKPPGPYSLVEHAQEAKLLMDHLGIKNAHVICTSYGGAVAMEFATLFPEYLKTISIINSISETDEILKLLINSWKTLASMKDISKFFWSVVPTIYDISFLKKNMEALNSKVLEMKKLPEDFLLGQLQLYDTFDLGVGLTDQLYKIKCPALVICGENDVLTPVKFSKIIAEGIPHSEFAIIPDCAHVTVFEKPDVLASLLLGFIFKSV